jgi:hypothetical protein
MVPRVEYSQDLKLECGGSLVAHFSTKLKAERWCTSSFVSPRPHSPLCSLTRAHAAQWCSFKHAWVTSAVAPSGTHNPPQQDAMPLVSSDTFRSRRTLPVCSLMTFSSAHRLLVQVPLLRPPKITPSTFDCRCCGPTAPTAGIQRPPPASNSAQMAPAVEDKWRSVLVFSPLGGRIRTVGTWSCRRARRRRGRGRQRALCAHAWRRAFAGAIGRRRR